MSLRHTPLHARHVEAGGRMVPFAGFELPVQYAGLSAEHQLVRSAVGLFDVSHMGEVRVRGPKARLTLQALLSNAVLRVADGQAQYNLLCNERGGIVDDTVIYRLAEDDWIVCVNAANREKDFAWITANNPHADVSITDESDAWAQIAIQGPLGPSVTAYLAEPDVLSLKRYRFEQGSFAGVAGCLLARTGYTGEDGFEVFCPAERAPHIWDALLEAGATHGIAPCGLGARNTLRLEARMPLYGNELTDDTTPLQAGLGWATKLRKPGGFLGSDAIAARRDTDTHQLVGFVMTDKRIARDGMAVFDPESDGEPIGHVTSGSKSPSTGRAIGLAYVPRRFANPGTALTIDVRGKPGQALVNDADFVSL
jgi:aminomethyltransferase